MTPRPSKPPSAAGQRGKNMRYILTLTALAAASPALAASKNPFSGEFYKLSNSDFIVAVSFFLFIGVLFYFKVPSLLGGLLLVVAALFESRLDQTSGTGAIDRLTSVAPENHWIVLGLFALMSVPGAVT